MLAVIRLRGRIGIKPDIRKTLELLKLDRKFTLAIVPDTPDFRGMIKRVNDYVTWGEVSEQVVEKLKKELRNCGKSFPVFHLHPPRGGFKGSIKKHLPYGELGYRGKEIEKLIEKMLPPKAEKKKSEK